VHLLSLAAQLPLERERATEDLRVERATVSSVSRRWRSGKPRTDVLARAVPAISSSIRSAYGRIASIRACALRSFAAATSSIARVILRVLRTERMRRLMSWTEAIAD